MEQRVSLITLGVADVPRSRAFYERLGWHASSFGNESVAFFQMGGTGLALYGIAAMEEDSGMKPGSAGIGGVNLAQNVRSPAEVDAVLAEAKAAGGVITMPGREAFWGGYFGHFADLDGHPWEIAWNPQFEILADGSIRMPD